LIHKQRPYVIFYGFSASLLKTLTAYLPLWFTSILINLFLAKTDTQSLFLSVLLFACCMLLSEGGQYVLEYRLNIAVKELELGLEKNISEKAMYLSYDKLEDKDTLDLIEKAKAGFMQNGGIQVMMAQFSALLEICCTIVISFGLLPSLSAFAPDVTLISFTSIPIRPSSIRMRSPGFTSSGRFL